MISERQIPQYVETMKSFEPRVERAAAPIATHDLVTQFASSSGHLLYTMTLRPTHQRVVSLQFFRRAPFFFFFFFLFERSPSYDQRGSNNRRPRPAARRVPLAASKHVAATSVDGARDGYLIAHSNGPVFTNAELDAVVAECEANAKKMGGWTTRRHANYPTTDVPLAELPRTLRWFRDDALPTVIYPFLAEHFGFAAPDPLAFRVVDAFVVKYNATAGQSRLAPHRDGAVVSFNVALNDWDEYADGGTYFDGLGTNLRSNKGHLLAHASGMLHGGHPITAGVRYILVAFVILRSYPDWAVRWYNHVRDR